MIIEDLETKASTVEDTKIKMFGFLDYLGALRAKK